MDVLQKISVLREERHWTEYQLAEKSGLTQSTISSWYRKNLTPSIPSLIKICDAFGITISQFFLDDTNKTVLLSEEQIELIEVAARLDKEQYHALLQFLKLL